MSARRCVIASSRRRHATPFLALTPVLLVDWVALLAIGGVLLLAVVIAVIALGAAFARRATTRRSCSCVLDRVLRIIPWYPSGERKSSGSACPWRVDGRNQPSPP